MPVAIASVVAALLLGAPAIQELVVRGIRGGETQPAVIGVVGVLVSVAILAAGLAHWRRRPAARRLLLSAGVAAVAFHLYAALPPHRYVGAGALILGIGVGIFLVVVALREPARLRAAA